MAAAQTTTTQLRGGTTITEETTPRHNNNYSRGLDANINNIAGEGNPDYERVALVGGDNTEGSLSSLPVVPGICQTNGEWDTVEDFAASTPIIPGWTYTMA